MIDDPDEIFDQVDEDDHVIGQITRKEANSNTSLIHRSVAIAVFNAKKELFLQKRSRTKDIEPGVWTISVSGHVSAGDYYDTSAHRELLEELGVDLKLHPLKRHLFRYPWETEMTKTYMCYCDGPFTLNADEIEEGRFFSENVGTISE